jgi:hypothetical protein
MLFISFNKEIEKKYCNVHELAMLLNVSPRKIQMLAKKGIIPKEHRGLYELLPCLHSYLHYLKKVIYHFVGFYSGKKKKGKTKIFMQESLQIKKITSLTSNEDLPPFDEIHQGKLLI